jgi:hypothetical protein
MDDDAQDPKPADMLAIAQGNDSVFENEQSVVHGKSLD